MAAAVGKCCSLSAIAPRLHSPRCFLYPQTAANWVLRESKAVYRAASEGVINLADKFFEMERADATRCVKFTLLFAATRHLSFAATVTSPNQQWRISSGTLFRTKAAAQPAASARPHMLAVHVHPRLRHARVPQGPGPVPRRAVAAREADCVLRRDAGDPCAQVSVLLCVDCLDLCLRVWRSECASVCYSDWQGRDFAVQRCSADQSSPQGVPPPHHSQPPHRTAIT